MVGGRDPSDTGCGAFADIAQQTGASGPLGAVIDGLSAGANREGLENCRQRLFESVSSGERPKVSGALDTPFAGEEHPRNVFFESNHEVGIGLIVAKPNIEFGLVLLDPEVFQVKCLTL